MAPSIRRPQQHPALLSPSLQPGLESPRDPAGPWQVEETLLRDQERGRRPQIARPAVCRSSPQLPCAPILTRHVLDLPQSYKLG